MSTLQWTSSTLALVDESYDADGATDGHSRFGAYLRKNQDSLRGYDDEPLSAAEFAAVVWRIATPPIMSRGYVRIRPDLAGITLELGDDDPELLVATVTVPVDHGQLCAGRSLLAGGWQDWDRDSWHRGDPFQPRIDPADERRAVLVVAQVRIPIATRSLPAPPQNGWTLASAKDAVTAVCDVVNGAAATTIAGLAPTAGCDAAGH